LHPSELEDFKTELRRHGRRASEFELYASKKEPPAISANAIMAVAGEVRVVSLATGVERTYASGHGSNWIAEFSDDVRAGVL